MNPFENIQNILNEKFKTIKHTLEYPLVTSRNPPRNPNGVWFLDIIINNKYIVLEWSPKKGYGISWLEENHGYGIGPDEVFKVCDEKHEQNFNNRVLEIIKKISKENHT